MSVLERKVYVATNMFSVSFFFLTDFASPSSSAMFFPASAWCSDSPQQGIPSEKWVIPQTNAKEQTQAQEDGAVNEQC